MQTIKSLGHERKNEEIYAFEWSQLFKEKAPFLAEWPSQTNGRFVQPSRFSENYQNKKYDFKTQ